MSFVYVVFSCDTFVLLLASESAKPSCFVAFNLLCCCLLLQLLVGLAFGEVVCFVLVRCCAGYRIPHAVVVVRTGCLVLP